MVRCALDPYRWFESDKAVAFEALPEGRDAPEVLYHTKTGIWVCGRPPESDGAGWLYLEYCDEDAALWLIRNRCDLAALPDAARAKLETVMAEMEV